ALKWFRLAANNGHVEARKQINALETPTPHDQLPDDLDQTEANKGDPSAQYALGLAYCEVKPQDYIRAYLWFTLAAAQGDKRAIKAGETIKQRMTPAQIAEAKKLEIHKALDEEFNRTEEELNEIRKEEVAQRKARGDTCRSCGCLIPEA